MHFNVQALRYQPLFRALRTSLLSRLVRIAYPFGKVRSCLAGPVKGMRFTVRPGMGLTYALGKDAWNWHWLSGGFSWRGTTVYDIGANRGQMTLWLAKMVGKAGTVVAFEPVPALFEDLLRNVELNSLKNVRAYCAAVSTADGETRFAFHDDYSTSGKIADCEPAYTNPRARTFSVKAVSLDSLLERGEIPPPDFLKIDVEGGAALVLQGAVSTIERYSPTIYIELHGPEEQAGVRDYLLRPGYFVENLAGKRVFDSTSAWENPLWCSRLTPPRHNVAV